MTNEEYEKEIIAFLELEIASLEHLYNVAKKEDPYDYITLFMIRDKIEEKKKDLDKARRKMFYMKRFERKRSKD